MTKAQAATVRADSGQQEPPAFYCAEVWGGNRPIDGPFELPGIRGWVFSQPCAGGRGGDIHYISLCSSGLISRMCVADVAGHGEQVAQVSQAIHTLLRRLMNTLDQRRVLAALNQRVARSEKGRMTTAVAITYFPPARRISVSYAGHPPAWLYRASEDRWFVLQPESRRHDMPGLIDLPLAADDQTEFTRRKERVGTGDRLILATDGVLEAPSPSEELFGEERLAAVLADHRRASAQELKTALLSALKVHTGGHGLAHDDVTLLVMDFVPGPRGFGVWHGLKRRLFKRPAGVLAAT